MSKCGEGQIIEYFDTVQKLYTFFSGSNKRWELLETELKDPRQPTLKRLCPTRWASRYDAVRSLRYRFTDVMMMIMRALTKISLSKAR